ncbi:sugar ABC transporter substrate-binding protein [Streptomyces beijiangensis]|uniref:Substrate-binding domain-containing protein n=1 Tax=Streptomyces beijiangensis TaxID=163361 RepID=A0A939JJ74_9ACTN|nr:substrate-binding domain-containing protein [Streptomyces beijiangensis]MBO0513349.1 substrate-binding domain-containing protein [Streptomyces beijiangensis]
MRRATIALASAMAAVSLSACSVVDSIGGADSSASPKKGDDITVGLLLPEKENSRYEKFDYPIIKKQVAELTNQKGKVTYANAEADPGKQNTQLQQMIDAKVDVILLDAVDSKAIASGVKKAKDAGIPVIAYDRLAQGPIDAYISFDNELVGEVQGRALIEALGTRAAKSKVVMMNGSASDPNAAQFKAGALSQLQGVVQIVKSYDTKGWKVKYAKANMKDAISAVGLGDIDAVYSANDGLAGAVIDTLKTAGVSKVPPVTGQDAELDGVQRVISGDQYMSVYKSYPDEASAAAELAVYKVQGRGIEFEALTGDLVDSPTNKGIPSRMVPVVTLKKDNIKETVVQEGIYTVKQICTDKYKSDCAAIGLK